MQIEGDPSLPGDMANEGVVNMMNYERNDVASCAMSAVYEEASFAIYSGRAGSNSAFNIANAGGGRLCAPASDGEQ